MKMIPFVRAAALAAVVLVFAEVRAQPAPEDRPRRFGPPGSGPGGPGGPGGRRGGPPGGVQEDWKLRKQFDKDKSKVLEAAERAEARKYIQAEAEAGRDPRRGPRGFGRGRGEPGRPGKQIAPGSVKDYPNAPLFDPAVLRTLFFEFESQDWEKELSDFYRTDVEVPAKLTVDGKFYKDVGVSFRGASSYFTVEEGLKRSLNVSIDLADEKQALYGHRTLNLLNSHGDPSFLRSVLYFAIAREYIPAPQASYVRVVINGENWGPYVSVEQFNKDFVQREFGTSTGARWKVPGSPGGNGGLAYMGDDPAPYKRIYEIKSKDEPKSWEKLIRLCRVLNETPAEQLEKEIAPILDVDGVLKFLAIENALINSDGYWIRASDYNLCQDSKGRFHVVPHDSNETFGPPRGPGGGGRRGGESGLEIDPLEGADDPAKPLLSKLLAVPKFKAQYLGRVRDIAQTWLRWDKIGPLAEKHHVLVADEVKADTRKLDSFEAFEASILPEGADGGPGSPRQAMNLKTFVEKRREYLLAHPEIKKLVEQKP
jgi:hypothetical protein